MGRQPELDRHATIIADLAGEREASADGQLPC
jgi:hypothetical protein